MSQCKTSNSVSVCFYLFIFFQKKIESPDSLFDSGPLWWCNNEIFFFAFCSILFCETRNGCCFPFVDFVSGYLATLWPSDDLWTDLANAKRPWKANDVFSFFFGRVTKNTRAKHIFEIFAMNFHFASKRNENSMHQSREIGTAVTVFFLFYTKIQEIVNAIGWCFFTMELR